jgi:membrane protein DedA with SNARE-associated domain
MRGNTSRIRNDQSLGPDRGKHVSGDSATMAFEATAEALIDMVRANQWLADPIAFGLGFTESIVLFSWFIPSSILLVGLGGVHGAAGGSVPLLWLFASAGTFAGDVVSYMMGRYMKTTIENSWPLKQHPDWLPKGHAFIERWGILGVIAGKFVGPLRPFIPLASGVMEMAWPKFLFASALSSMIWAGAFLAPGFIGSLWLMD